MTFYDRLKKICDEKGISMFSVQQGLGLSSSSTTYWKKGQSPRISTLKQIADYLDIPLYRLTGQEQEIENAPITSQALGAMVLMPIIGTVKAGFGLTAEEQYTGEFMSVPVDALHNNPQDYRVLNVTGDSMYPFFLPEKDRVIVHLQPVAESGDFVVAIVNGEGMLKKLHVDQDGTMQLVSINPLYPPIVMGVNDRIYGKVTRSERIL